MNASESLIDKFNGRFAIYVDQTFVFDLAIDEISMISKSLRFAADMEKLALFDIQIERGDQPGDEWLITVDTRCEEIQVSDRSIYSAARKAVEALEEKQ